MKRVQRAFQVVRRILLFLLAVEDDRLDNREQEDRQSKHDNGDPSGVHVVVKQFVRSGRSSPERAESDSDVIRRRRQEESLQPPALTFGNSHCSNSSTVSNTGISNSRARATSP